MICLSSLCLSKYQFEYRVLLMSTKDYFFFKEDISIDNVIEDVIYHICTTKVIAKLTKNKKKWNEEKGKPIGKLSIMLRVLKRWTGQKCCPRRRWPLGATRVLSSAWHQQDRLLDGSQFNYSYKVEHCGRGESTARQVKAQTAKGKSGMKRPKMRPEENGKYRWSVAVMDGSHANTTHRMWLNRWCLFHFHLSTYLTWAETNELRPLPLLPLEVYQKRIEQSADFPFLMLYTCVSLSQ